MPSTSTQPSSLPSLVKSTSTASWRGCCYLCNNQYLEAIGVYDTDQSKQLDQIAVVACTRVTLSNCRYANTRNSFPINVNIEKNKETDQFEVEIRNFIGEKLVRTVVMRPGVHVEASKTQKDELQLSGNVSCTLLFLFINHTEQPTER